MTSNEYIYQNNLITPITPFSSDFVNSLTNNPDSSNLEEPIICKQQTQKKKIICKEMFFEILYIFYSHFSFFFNIGIYYLHINFIFI